MPNFKLFFVSYIIYTIRIQFFVECSALCRVHFIGHSTKHSLSSSTLGELRLSTQTSFAEGKKTRHKKTVNKGGFTECQALGEMRRSAKGRQQLSIVDDH
jgi:superfamily II DNA or RNA helicase